MREMQVFADGKKEVVASTNARLGWIVKPSGGSLSAPVVNCRTLPRLKPAHLPPLRKTNMTNCFSEMFSVGYLLTYLLTTNHGNFNRISQGNLNHSSGSQIICQQSLKQSGSVQQMSHPQ